MQPSNDYYKLLGVSHDATAEEIRKAYRKLARQYHPDVNKAPDAATRFAEINEAYEVLSDAEKRRSYDQFGRAGVGATTGRPGGATWSQAGFGGSPGADFDAGDLGSIFEQMFGARGPGGAPGTATSPFGGDFGSGSRPVQSPPQRGRDLSHELPVSFMTAVRGGKEEVRFQLGAGYETIEVRIPAGIESGAKLRVKGKGQPAPSGNPGGKPGDLIITVTVGQHPYFRRDGLNLLIDVPISIAEAGLGTEVDVPLIEGSVQIRIPPGASSGQKLRVPGKGIQDSRGAVGDFLAVVQIVAPSSLTDSARQSLEALAPELKNPRESAPWAEH